MNRLPSLSPCIHSRDKAPAGHTAGGRVPVVCQEFRMRGDEDQEGNR